MNKTMQVILIYSMAFMLFSLTGCGEPKKEKKLTPEQTTEKIKQEEEKRKKSAARINEVLVESQGLDIVSIQDSKIILRTALKFNNKLDRLIAHSVPMNKNLTEEFELQDKTTEISPVLPQNFLEISSYRFSSGRVSMLALEIRSSKIRNNRLISASEFILMILDKSLGHQAIKKIEFEFPTTSSLEAWAKKAQTSTMTPDEEAELTASDITSEQQKSAEVKR